jgi:hypothetical protein
LITTLKRIHPGTAFKVGIVVNGLIAAIFGLLLVLLPSLLFTSTFSRMYTNDPEFRAIQDSFAFAGGLSLLCFYLIGVVMTAIFGGIYFAVGAVIYNLTAKWVGGLEIELQSTPGGFLDEIERDIAEAKRKNF